MLYRTGLSLMLLAVCVFCLTMVAASNAGEPVQTSESETRPTLAAASSPEHVQAVQ